MNRLFLLSLFALACGGAPAPATEAAAAGPATVDVSSLPEGASISESYRFALRPDAEWSLATREQLRSFGGPPAAAAYYRGGDGFGIVVVESMAGTDLERAAELTVGAFAADNRTLEEQTSVRYRGYPAIHQVITGRVEGMPVRWTNLLFLHQAHLYRLTVWGRDLDAPGVASFRALFALLDGAVQRPPQTTPDAVGVDWRLEGGRFESIAADITVRAGEHWRVVVGDELDQLNDRAVVGLRHAEPDVYVVVLSEHVPEQQRERVAAHLRDTTAQNIGVPPSGQRPVQFMGGEVQASVYRVGSIEYLHAVRCGARHCRQLLAWYVEGASDAAREAMATMPMVEPLSADARVACQRTLTTRRRERRTFGAGYAYRGNTYIDFRRGLTLQAPEGSYWEMNREPATELRFFDRVHGTFGLFQTEALEEDADSDAYHRQVQEAINIPPTTPHELEVGGVRGHESEGPSEAALGTFEFRVFTTVIDRRGYRFGFWGWPEHMQRSRERIEALVETATLHGGPIPVFRIEGGRLIDERIGAALRPPEGWEYNDFTAPSARGLTVVHGFTYPDGSLIQLFAARGTGDEAARREHVASTMVQRMRGAIGGGEPQRSSGTLAGREALTVRWRGGTLDVEMRFVVIDQVTYGIIVIGRQDMAAVVESFELLD